MSANRPNTPTPPTPREAYTSRAFFEPGAEKSNVKNGVYCSDQMLPVVVSPKSQRHKANNASERFDIADSLEKEILAYIHISKYPETMPTAAKSTLKAGTYAYKIGERIVNLILPNDIVIFNFGDLVHNINARTTLEPIKELLNEDLVNKFFDAGSHIVPMKDSEGRVLHYFHFKLNPASRLLIRKDKYGKIVADVIHAGRENGLHAGVTHEVVGTIKQRYDMLGSIIRYEPRYNNKANDKRTCRLITNNSPGELLRIIASEHALTKHGENLGVRDLFFGRTSKGVPCAGFTLKRSNDDTLQSIIDADMDAPFLSMRDRFLITIALLEALKTQAHDRGVILRNLNPRDISVKTTGDYWSATLTNFSSARFGHQEDGKDIGLTAFTPRELVRRNASAQLNSYSADIFTFALFMALVWRDEEQYDQLSEPGITPTDIQAMREQNDWHIKIKPFYEIEEDDLSQNSRRQIEGWIKQMLSPNTFARPNAKECVDFFKNLYFQYKKSRLSPEEGLDLKKAEKIAFDIKNLMDEYKDKSATPTIAKEFSQRYESLIKQLPDNALSVTHFIDAVGIAFMKRLTNKDTLITNLEYIKSDRFMEETPDIVIEPEEENISVKPEPGQDIFKLPALDKTISSCVPASPGKKEILDCKSIPSGFLLELSELQTVYEQFCKLANEQLSKSGPLDRIKLGLIEAMNKNRKIMEELEATPMRFSVLDSAMNRIMWLKCKMKQEMSYFKFKFKPETFRPVIGQHISLRESSPMNLSSGFIKSKKL